MLLRYPVGMEVSWNYRESPRARLLGELAQ